MEAPRNDDAGEDPVGDATLPTDDATRDSSENAPGASDASGSRFTWNPDGDDVARALLARAKAASKPGGRRTQRSSRSRPWRRDARSSGSGWSGPGGDERDPQAIGTAMDRLAGEHGWDENLAVHGVVARWDDLVGPEIAAHVRPESYADNVLTVRADSTAWATQVRLLASQLVAKLNREIGDGMVVRVAVVGPQAPKWRKGPRSVPGRGPRDTYG